MQCFNVVFMRCFNVEYSSCGVSHYKSTETKWFDFMNDLYSTSSST